jgi:uncharacterized alpha-E superfamily protein
MLSRVAERIYWMARYLERAENTARIVNVNSNLLLDLPRSITLGWEPLINITGSKISFRRRRLVNKERNVVQFLISDLKNPGSLLNTLQYARENARTIRDIIPREAWEHINALYLSTKSELPGGLAQRRRFDFLGSVISGTQQITGLLAGTMLHDAGYYFLRMGRNLERADMTTRIIDVQASNLLPDNPEELLPYENIQWMSVLQSLSGYQSYRQKMQGRVHRGAVLGFLLQDKEFPRAFLHCLGEVGNCLGYLPRSDLLIAETNRIEKRVSKLDTERLQKQTIHEFIDSLQKELGKIHNMISRNYFIIPVEKKKSGKKRKK